MTTVCASVSLSLPLDMHNLTLNSICFKRAFEWINNLQFFAFFFSFPFSLTRFVTNLDKKAQSGTRETTHESIYGMESN